LPDDGVFDFSVFEVHESTAPAALPEMEVYHELPAAPAPVRWWLFALTVVGVFVLVATVAWLWG